MSETTTEQGWLLPELEGKEKEAAIQEYVTRERSLPVPPQPTLREQLVRGATRRRLIRKARKNKWDGRYYDYYTGIPHVSRASVKRSVMRGYSHRLVITATTNGVHSATSLHKVGKAVDFGNILRHVGPTAEGRRRLVEFQLNEYHSWRSGDRPHLQELIGPDNNAVVLQGRHCPLPEGSPLENQHDNHVHEGFWN